MNNWICFAKELHGEGVLETAWKALEQPWVRSLVKNVVFKHDQTELNPIAHKTDKSHFSGKCTFGKSTLLLYSEIMYSAITWLETSQINSHEMTPTHVQQLFVP